MKTNEHPPGKRILPGLPQVFGAASAGLGLIALLAWIFELPVVASFGAGLIPMAPSTALLFTLLGFSVFFHNRVPQSRGAYLMAMVLSSLSAVTALLLFFFSSAGIYSPIEHLGISISGTINGAPVGHMSPITAFSFLVLTLSFIVTLSSSSRWPGRTLVAFLSACLIGLVSVVLMVAYSFGTPLLYGGDSIPPALPTSLAFFFLAIAVLTSAGLQIWPTSRMEEAGAAHTAYFLGLVFVLLTSGILAIGYSHYRNFEQRYMRGIEDQLSAVADLKAGDLVQWRKERMGDASVFHRNANFSGLVRQYLETPKDINAQTRVRTWMRQVRESYVYDRVCLHDAALTERLSYPDGLEPTDSLFKQQASAALRSGKIVFQDFYRDEHDGRVYLSLLIPILDPQQSDRAIGILALRIEPETYLYPLLKRWPSPSRTAETLLIRREGTDALFLNDPRFGDHTALNLHIPLTNTTTPAVKAALGQEGTGEGVDYRRVPVLANVRAIPNSPWFMVARMDLSEIRAPLRERLWMTVFLIGALLVSAGAGVGVVWKQQRARFYREQYKSERERAWLHDVIARSLNEVYVFDPQTLRFKLVNAGARRNIGYSAQEMANLTPLAIKPEYTEKTFRSMVQPLLNGEQEALVFQTVHRRKDGSQYPVEVHLQRVERPEGAVFLAMVNDITERKREAEEASRMVTVVRDSNDAITIQDFEGKITAWNRGAELMFGYSEQEALQMKIWQLAPPDKAAEQKDFTRRLIAGEKISSFETQRLTKDGRLLDVWLTVTKLVDDAGKIIGIAATARDITEHKQAEEEIQKLNAELEQKVLNRTAQLEAANKEMEAFSYSVSHDLRAPLRAIDGFSRVILEEYANTLDAEGRRLLSVIRENTLRMAQLIDDLLALSRVGRSRLKLSRVSMTKLAKSAFEELVPPADRQQGEFTVSELPNAYGDEALIKQVWMNLISNAWKFSRTQERRVINIGGRTEGGECVYVVKDNGVGFDETYKHKLFGVFQRLHTTKEFEGTGVGLAIVQRIVTRHGGRVWAEGKVNEGATFYFTLPITQGDEQ